MHMLHGDLVGRSEGEYFRWLRESVDLPWRKSVEEFDGEVIALLQNKTIGGPFVESRQL